MPKKSKQQFTPVSKKHLSRREREQRQRRMLFIGGAIVLVVIVSVLAVGFYQEYVARPSTPIAVVNGQVITTREYQFMVKYRRFDLAGQMALVQDQLSRLDPTAEDQQFLIQYFQQQSQQLQTQGFSLPTQVLDDMVDDELVRQEAARRGITVVPEEVQQEIERQFGYDRTPPTPTPTPITSTVAITLTPTPTQPPMSEEDFQKNYGEYISALRKNAGFTEATFRSLFESSLYHQKLQDSLAEEVPATAEQVHARHILLETEEEAEEVLEGLQAGEDFAALADELSIDTSTEGGDLGWFPRGQMVSEFEDVAFALGSGETSDIVETSFGYHIINLIERDENHLLDEAILEQRRASALEEWLAEQRYSDGVERYWSSDKVPPTS